MKLFYQSLFLLSLFLFVMACKKEEDEPIINTETYEVAPNLTNGDYGSGETPHLVMRHANVNSDRLILFLGGTWSKPDNYQEICDYIRSAGYHVISLAYPNNVPAASLDDSENPEVYSQYRQEICYGTPISLDVTVDSLNSIDQRFRNLISYLAETKPEEGWSNYVSAGEPIWSKITVAGHSQGSGHAGYIAKQVAVDRVVMFAGPNDFQTSSSSPGDWLADGSATALSDYYAFLHAEDDVASYANQVENLRAMNVLGIDDTTIQIESQSGPNFGGYNSYHTNLEVISEHSSVANSKWHMSSFWNYLFDL